MLRKGAGEGAQFLYENILINLQIYIISKLKYKIVDMKLRRYMNCKESIKLFVVMYLLGLVDIKK